MRGLSFLPVSKPRPVQSLPFGSLRPRFEKVAKGNSEKGLVKYINRKITLKTRKENLITEGSLHDWANLTLHCLFYLSM